MPIQDLYGLTEMNGTEGLGPVPLDTYKGDGQPQRLSKALDHGVAFDNAVDGRLTYQIGIADQAGNLEPSTRFDFMN